MRLLLAVVLLTALVPQQQPPAGYSPVQDGEPHGDPPYQLEDGWEPL